MNVVDVMGPGGLLAGHFDGFEVRVGQLAMAERVATCFASGGVLLVEAGTGTGKTLAYLTPAVLHGRRVVVSTATRNLQDQIVERELPLITSLIGIDVRWAVLKGRTNYLCRLRLEQMRAADAAGFGDRYWRAINAWADHTATGDRVEVGEVPEDAPIWRELTTTMDSCVGYRCTLWSACHVREARSRAEVADIVVVNHHLYFADCAVRADGGAVLPPHDTVIFDEAHAVADIAAPFFGDRISDAGVDDWADDLRRITRRLGLPAQAIDEGARAVCDAASRFFDALAPPGDSGRAGWLPREATSDARDLYFTLDNALEGVGAHLDAHGANEPEPEIERLGQRARGLRETLGRLMEPTDVDAVYFRERRARSVLLSSQPAEVAPRLQTALYDTMRSVILTSASLTVAGRFDYLRRRLGVGEDAAEVRFESPFDYGAQARFYIPRAFPRPDAAGFSDAVVDAIHALTSITEGRAFVLFTSHRNLRVVARKLDAEGFPFSILRQGDAPRARLLDQFRASSGAVLLATSSFWEGVDVPGEALSLVIIDKLPFEPPDDPVFAARAEACREAGGRPFVDLYVPQAVLALEQGVGRLIRAHRDRGIVALLDIRLRQKGYGRIFLRSLPPAPVVDDLHALAMWWKSGLGDQELPDGL